MTKACWYRFKTDNSRTDCKLKAHSHSLVPYTQAFRPYSRGQTRGTRAHSHPLTRTPLGRGVFHKVSRSSENLPFRGQSRKPCEGTCTCTCTRPTILSDSLVQGRGFCFVPVHCSTAKRVPHICGVRPLTGHSECLKLEVGGGGLRKLLAEIGAKRSTELRAESNPCRALVGVRLQI